MAEPLRRVVRYGIIAIAALIPEHSHRQLRRCALCLPHALPAVVAARRPEQPEPVPVARAPSENAAAKRVPATAFDENAQAAGKRVAVGVVGASSMAHSLRQSGVVVLVLRGWKI